MSPGFGALVLSLDFELHWGVRDVAPADGDYRQNLLGVREAIPAMLEVFKEFEVSATWATVGLLFASNKGEAQAFAPRLRPQYRDQVLNPYDEPCGEDESSDPLHFAPSLIAAIQATPHQEIATHTFSHYYCLAAGQTRETFQADLASAIAIARQRGVRLTSIVFPRNEHNPDYDDVLIQTGITCYRGNPPFWMYRPTHGRMTTLFQRAVRMVHDYFDVRGDGAFAWSEVRQPNGLSNVRASAFLRPFNPRLARFEPRRLIGVSRLLARAAGERKIAHIWWHPHNFGVHLDDNITMLRRLLETFARMRDRHQMRSLTMGDIVELAPRP